MSSPRPLPSLALVTCFFGQTPAWIRIYLKTAQWNPDVKFFIFTDCIPDLTPESNVQIIPCTLEDICRKASLALNLDIDFDHPFKLNDLRPAFGVILADYLKGFDFWGYVEVDMIYGHIRSFITADMMAAYDVITSRPEYITGHFTLFRNVDHVNALFERSADYPKIFVNPKHYSFSECNFIWGHLLEGNPLHEAEIEVESITHVMRKAEADGLIRAWYPHLVRECMDLRKDAWLLMWDRGRLFDLDADEEILYFHFHVHKYRPHFLVPDWLEIPDRFYVHESGFFV